MFFLITLNSLNLKMEFNNLLETLNNNKPVLALIYIILSFIAAFIIDKIFIRFFRTIVKKSTTNLDDKIVEILHKPLYYSILFFGLNLSVQLLNFPDVIVYSLVGICKTLIIIMWSFALFRSFIILIKWSSYKTDKLPFIQAKTIPLFENLGKIVIFLVSIYFVMLIWDIDVTAWVASAGILSVVIGFAAKDTLGNLFAGIFIMADSPYKEGDYINLDTGERGFVRHIGVRSTRILTRDAVEITIPNSVIATSKIINESGGYSEQERIRITLSVAYGTKIEKAKEIMYNIAIESDSLSKDPLPKVRFRTFGESGLNLQLLAWIDKPELRGRVIDELSTSIYNAFNEEKIEIPFPQRTVHVKKSDI
tara:strand:+ start:123 stop:1217 length:1095 start_codon:yes stop_codon:yes gene_type:complete